jgi:hypothetical protein
VLEALLRATPDFHSAEDLLEQVWDEHADPFTNLSPAANRVRRAAASTRRGHAARFIVESIARFAWHRKGDPASAMISGDQARATVRYLVVAAFASDSQNSAAQEARHDQ